MGVTKRSVSIDDEIAAQIEDAAAEDDTTFSAWLAEAARRQLRIRAGLRAVAEYEAEVGQITDEQLAAARARRERLQAQARGERSPRLDDIRRWAQEHGYQITRTQVLQ